MDSVDGLLDICGHFRDLGNAVTEQLVDFVEGERGQDKLNPNAVGMCKDFLIKAGHIANRNGDEELAVALQQEVDAMNEWLAEVERRDAKRETAGD